MLAFVGREAYTTNAAEPESKMSNLQRPVNYLAE